MENQEVVEEQLPESQSKKNFFQTLKELNEINKQVRKLNREIGKRKIEKFGAEKVGQFNSFVNDSTEKVIGGLKNRAKNYEEYRQKIDGFKAEYAAKAADIENNYYNNYSMLLSLEENVEDYCFDNLDQRHELNQELQLFDRDETNNDTLSQVDALNDIIQAKSTELLRIYNKDEAEAKQEEIRELIDKRNTIIEPLVKESNEIKSRITGNKAEYKNLKGILNQVGQDKDDLFVQSTDAMVIAQQDKKVGIAETKNIPMFKKMSQFLSSVFVSSGKKVQNYYEKSIVPMREGLSKVWNEEVPSKLNQITSSLSKKKSEIWENVKNTFDDSKNSVHQFLETRKKEAEDKLKSKLKEKENLENTEKIVEEPVEEQAVQAEPEVVTVATEETPVIEAAEEPVVAPAIQVEPKPIRRRGRAPKVKEDNGGMEI